jgi:hypothetical protein
LTPNEYWRAVSLRLSLTLSLIPAFGECVVNEH